MNLVLDTAPSLIQATHGRGSRATKLQVMHRYLAFKWSERPGPDGTVEQYVKPWERPLLRFTKRCKNVQRTIPSLPYKDNPHGGPEDVDTESDDHPYDGVTAFLMSRPPAGYDWPGEGPEQDDHPGMDRRGKRKIRPYEKAMREFELRSSHTERHEHTEPSEWEPSEGVWT